MINNNLKYLVFLLFSVLVLSSCEEDLDITSPTINISSPSEGDAFSLSEEIEVVGRVTDDRTLKNVVIQSPLGVDQTVSTFDNSSDFPFIITIILDSNTVAGSYNITIKAVDISDNEAETTVNVVIE